jgi:hypothetical protein
MAGSFRLLREDKTLGGSLLGFGALNWFTMPTILFIPFFANQVFHSGAQGLGAMEASLGGGMMLAVLYWARKGEVQRRAPMVVGGIAVVGLAILGMGLWPSQRCHMGGWRWRAWRWGA